jgi:hypothetical protein
MDIIFTTVNAYSVSAAILILTETFRMLDSVSAAIIILTETFRMLDSVSAAIIILTETFRMLDFRLLPRSR